MNISHMGFAYIGLMLDVKAYKVMDLRMPVWITIAAGTGSDQEVWHPTLALCYINLHTPENT